MNYQEKYLKYKKKYLKLKKQLGGELEYPSDATILHAKLFSIVNYIKLERPIPVGFFGPPMPIPKLTEKDFDNFLVEIHNPQIANLMRERSILKSLVYKNYAIGDTIWRVGDPIYQTKLENNWAQPIIDYLYERFGKETIDRIMTEKDIVIPAPIDYKPSRVDCSVDYIMNNNKDTIEEQCQKRSLYNVLGSCKEPSFLDSDLDITSEERNKWIELLSKLNSKLMPDKKITIILGAITNKPIFSAVETHVDTQSINLFVNPIYSMVDIGIKPTDYFKYKRFVEFLNEIDTTQNFIGVKLFLNENFPLSHRQPNSRQVLDTIGAMADKIKIVNRICASCFRSLYYLVNEYNVEYVNEPEQGYSYADTDAIINCFKP